MIFYTIVLNTCGYMQMQSYIIFVKLCYMYMKKMLSGIMLGDTP